MWREELKRILDLLCKIYKGTPCSWGEMAISDMIDDIHDYWSDEACSPLAGEPGQTALADLQTHLALPGNDLTSGDDAKLDEIIAACLVSS